MERDDSANLPDAVVLRRTKVVVNGEVAQKTLRSLADRLPSLDRERLVALSAAPASPTEDHSRK